MAFGRSLLAACARLGRTGRDGAGGAGRKPLTTDGWVWTWLENPEVQPGMPGEQQAG